MATLTLTLLDTCGGGGHLTLNVQINANDKGNLYVGTADVLGEFSDDEIDAVVKGVLRLHKIGKTLAQVRSDLLAGLTVTL